MRYNFCETGLGQYKNSHFRHEISDQLLIFWPLFNLPTTFAKRSRAKAPDATANSGMPKIPALRSLISAPISHQKVRKKVEKKKNGDSYAFAEIVKRLRPKGMAKHIYEA